MDIQAKCIDAYRRHKHLKLAAQEVGIPWQTLYVHLRRAGEPVTGDKTRYGSDTDRLAARAEQMFAGIVPGAQDMNGTEFQAKCDFRVDGYLVDVKASTLRRSSSKYPSMRWAFCVKKQESIADFFVCFGLDDSGEAKLILLIPGELARRYATISVPDSGGKWRQYEVTAAELADLFATLPKATAA